MSLGSRIREYRRKRGFTQSQIAAKLNMTEANFSSYERDKSIPPSEKLSLISSLLDVSTDYLLGKTDDPTPPKFFIFDFKNEDDVKVEHRELTAEETKLHIDQTANEVGVSAGIVETSNALNPKEEKDIAIDLERMLSDLESDQALAFHGQALDDESKELLRISLENSLRLAKQMAKQKFTPKKHRK